MSIGLLALLDDVASMTKVAASSLDDITAQAFKAGAKTTSLVIDDTAVAPRFVAGLDSSRELSIVWRITKGSLRNKLIYLLPVAIGLSVFAPWAIAPLLLLGGAYLSYEAAEKVGHWLHPASAKARQPSKSENARVRGAIQTDFILSAEIMTVALQMVSNMATWQRAVVLAIVGVTMTALVYGAVALLVRLDDIGMRLARSSSAIWRKSGKAVVAGVPIMMRGLSILGTAAMAWVGGQILVHNLAKVGWAWPDERIGGLADAAGWAGLPVEFGLLGLVGVTVGAVLAGAVALAGRLWRRAASLTKVAARR